MSESDNKALYERFVHEVVNSGNFGLIPDLYDANYTDHSAPPGAPGGLDGVAAVFAMFRGGFPDVHFDIKIMVAQGDKVATLVNGTGTNDGDFMGNPASHKAARWGSVGIFRVTDNKISEHWGIPDLLALMTQIGLIPAPPAPPAADTPEPTPRAEQPAAAGADGIDANIATVRWLFDRAYSQGDVAELDAKVAADFVDHPALPMLRPAPTGPDALVREIEVLRKAFPDLSTPVEDVISEGNWVVTRGTWTGTQTGDFFQIPATGKAIAVNAINFFRLDGGQIVERHAAFDTLALMQQLGLAPHP